MTKSNFWFLKYTSFSFKCIKNWYFNWKNFLPGSFDRSVAAKKNLTILQICHYFLTEFTTSSILRFVFFDYSSVSLLKACRGGTPNTKMYAEEKGWEPLRSNDQKAMKTQKRGTSPKSVKIADLVRSALDGHTTDVMAKKVVHRKKEKTSFSYFYNYKSHLTV